RLVVSIALADDDSLQANRICHIPILVLFDDDLDIGSLSHRFPPCYCRQSRGSAIVPDSALAATVSGLARNTFASLCPMRPGKLRLVVLMHDSGVLSRPKVSLGPPRQAAQLASPIFAPAARKMSRSDLPPIF